MEVKDIKPRQRKARRHLDGIGGLAKLADPLGEAIRQIGTIGRLHRTMQASPLAQLTEQINRMHRLSGRANGLQQAIENANRFQNIVDSLGVRSPVQEIDYAHLTPPLHHDRETAEYAIERMVVERVGEELDRRGVPSFDDVPEEDPPPYHRDGVKRKPGY